jgi:hypothetical protein
LTVEAAKDAGLRDRVEVMVCSGQISEETRKYTAARNVATVD